MFNTNWIQALNANDAVVVIFIIGVLFALYVISSVRAIWGEIKGLREDIKAVVATGSRLDTHAFGASLAIRTISASIDGMPEIILIHQSADGEGNYTLNRDIV